MGFVVAVVVIKMAEWCNIACRGIIVFILVLNLISARRHTNNWAVLVSTSRFWFNYRHAANTLSVYHSIKRLGIPDSHIILMLADDAACSPRNPRPATIFNNRNQHINVYGDDIEVDYRGYEVTAENFIRILTGRLEDTVPRSKRLLSDETSNIFIYLTGHGGDGFLKFQDSEEITSIELADAFEQMWQKGRYNELLLLVDTCQAESLYMKLYSPNVIAGASSKIGEDSLSHHSDPSIGVHVIDSWTYHVLQYLEQVTQNSTYSLDDFFRATSDQSLVMSTPNQRTDLFQRDIDKTRLTDFLGSVHSVHLQSEPWSIMDHCYKCRSIPEEAEERPANTALEYVDQMAVD